MSERLVLTPSGNDYWELVHKYTRKIGNRTVEVPKGFVCDLASIPRFLWALLPPFGLYTTAAVVHDKLCCYEAYDGQMSYAEADKIFLKLMLEDGVNPTLANLMYWAVNLRHILIKFGGKQWQKKKTRS